MIKINDNNNPILKIEHELGVKIWEKDNEVRNTYFVRNDQNQIIHLSIESLRLTEIPRSILELNKIVSISFAGNHFDSSIDFSVLQDLKLKSLDLSGCGFVEFPESVLELKSLDTFLFNYNRIRSIPTSLESLSKLEMFSCIRNLVEKVDVDFSNFDNLQGLGLSHNKIVNLNLAKELQEIRVLGLSSNLIKKIPDTLINSPNLQYLSMRTCELEEVILDELERSGRSKLREIDLSKNKISNFRISLELFPNLEKLILKGNKLNKKQVLSTLNETSINVEI